MTHQTEIRLACRYCDDDSADGVIEIPPGWEDVQEVDATARPDEFSDWWTHIGTCPDCVKSGL